MNKIAASGIKILRSEEYHHPKRKMKPRVDLNDVGLCTTLRAGDLGYIFFRHGKRYGDEYRYGVSLMSYVAGGMYEFHKS
jgi:hypothetical protein